MANFRIWVDADSCPASVKNIILKAAIRLNLNVFYVANRNIPFSIQSPLFEMIICSKEENAADMYIIEHVLENDIVITRDLPLAKLLLEKNISVLNDRGTLFTQKIVEEKLAQRELNLFINSVGIHTGGKYNTFGKKETYEFANCFDKLLNKKITK